MPRDKLIIGIPAYGRSYTLSTDKRDLHAPGTCALVLIRRMFVVFAANGPGYPGQYTKTRGFLSYYEICEKGQAQDWQRVWLDSEKGWYMTKDDQWITYEDIDSAALKVIESSMRDSHLFVHLGSIRESGAARWAVHLEH